MGDERECWGAAEKNQILLLAQEGDLRVKVQMGRRRDRVGQKRTRNRPTGLLPLFSPSLRAKKTVSSSEFQYSWARNR
jgi:hypothetical protein